MERKRTLYEPGTKEKGRETGRGGGERYKKDQRNSQQVTARGREHQGRETVTERRVFRGIFGSDLLN